MEFASTMYKTLIVLCWIYAIYITLDWFLIKIGAICHMPKTVRYGMSRRIWSDKKED